ncbi:hypothetical protein I3271_05355 [Photobacterium leiognathi]|uniref:hypothetical protein n=1 Tax=Photobacterium leiognathi TaxID=553611 RepID=UPI001EE049CC|nr:hypothetical protein [Photobacterium leiognathi]MCG3884107.1 hypothetical protein [Photobacterium leiognathi]
MGIPFTQSNVAEVAVAPINADATLSAGGAGNRLIFAGLTVASKGKPFEVLSVNVDNFKAILGKAYHPSLGKVSEPLRHIADAVKGGNGLVVRVVPEDAKFPVLKLTVPAKSKTSALTSSAQPFDSEVELADAEKLAIYIEDGAVSTNRAIEIKQADAEMYGAGMYEIIVHETDISGFESELEKHIVSLKPEALNDMGMPAFIETVLESQSKVIRAIVAHDLTELPTIAKTKFVGGTEGNIKSISSTQYDKALAVLKASVTQFTHVLGLGCYEPAVIKGLIAIANDRRIGAYFDLDPRLSFEQAAQAKVDLAIGDERAAFYHMPFSCVDPTYRCKAIWGLSGIAFVAKAKGVMKTSPTGGWHYTPAGEERALITRTGLRQLASAGVPDYEKMYKVRINKLATNKAGYLFIDDSLTSCVKENYLRFEQIVSVTDAVSRDFVQLANALKHEPDGVTYEGLVKGMTRILDSYVATGALVTPTHPEIDGKEPYKLIIKKTDKDAWKVSFALSITGSGRRFMGEPILIA